MIKSYKEIIGTSIVSFETAELIAIVYDVIINPDNGKIEALWVKPATIPIDNGVLLTNSILNWKQKIYIKDEREIALPEDVIKVADILSKEILFIGNEVKNEAKSSLGMVSDLDFDTNKLYIRNIYTHKSLLLFTYQPRVFSYDSIIEAFPTYILVKDKQTTKLKKGIKIEPVSSAIET